MKIAWIDTETGGTDSGKHSLLQLHIMVEIDGQIEGEMGWNIHPLPGTIVAKDSLKITGLTEEAIRSFPPAAQVKKELEIFLGQFVDKFNKADKFVPAGYCVAFDCDFLRAWFTAQGDKYYGSWFSPYVFDLFHVICHYRFQGFLGLSGLPNLKLGTVCEYFGIDLGEAAHDARNDINATRELWRCLAQLVTLSVTEDSQRALRSNKVAAAPQS